MLHQSIFFSSHYSSLQCHTILQKSFKYADLLLKKHFLILSMLETVVQLNIFVETFNFSGFFDKQNVQKNTYLKQNLL